MSHPISTGKPIRKTYAIIVTLLSSGNELALPGQEYTSFRFVGNLFGFAFVSFEFSFDSTSVVYAFKRNRTSALHPTSVWISFTFFSFPSSIFQKHSTNVVYKYILQLSFVNVKKKDK